MVFNNIEKYDKKLFSFVKEELFLQENKIELLSSINYSSLKIIELQNCKLINKNRSNIYYLNNIEKLAIKRACKLFGCDYANIIFDSYNEANELIYKALTNSGDIIICISINHYNSDIENHYNFLGRKIIYIKYQILNNEIKKNKILELINKYKPKLIKIILYEYILNIDWAIFRKISNYINSYLIIDISKITGLIIINEYPTPINYAHIVITSTNNNLRGPIGGLILSKNNPDICNIIDSFLFINNKSIYKKNSLVAKSVCFKEALDLNFKNYQLQIRKNVKVMIEIFINRGYEIILNNEKNSFFLISLIEYGIKGKYIKYILKKINILVDIFFISNYSKNLAITSGIKLCTSAITTRGFKEKECKNLAIWICDILDNIKNKKNFYIIKKKINIKVNKLCKKIPIYK
ncbi:hypothetical protein [Candidatus Portiera aleyrodidarum]|uniref:Serine hydroxymethyltransferase n=1 Tax=Candidatus Portiera aleyrodidarum TaxID=91844 RepID=A0A8D9JPY4_9GAMM|nr:hypothetical protein [Candidatus Portiera aleyrodidarum]CEI58758.1 Serine hydroxymethyltransferase [Candidatus Portiera aleyrodidarum]